MLESEEEIFVEFLRLFTRLFEQALPLHEGIVQLGVAGRDFLAVDDQLENVDHRVVVRVLLRKRNQLLRAMRDEERVEGFLLDQLLEDVLGDFEIRHLRLHLDPELAALGAAFFTR